MALKLITKFSNGAGTRIAKVYRDTEWDEYRVKFFRNGKHEQSADYFTDNLSDAQDTARFETQDASNYAKLTNQSEYS